MQTTQTPSFTFAIAGGLGRMGRVLIEAAARDGRVTLAAASVKEAGEIPQAQALLRAYGFTNVPVVTGAGALADATEAVIDFTHPAYSLELAGHIAPQRKIHIIGTTGFDAAQQDRLKEYAQSARVVQSGNFSLGVNVAARLIEQAAKLLSPEYDIEILEMHHRHKKDAPSGTALLLGEAAAKGRGVELAQARRNYPEGEIGAREHGAIGIAVRRGGEVVGEHTVTFAGDHDIIDISHRSFSRAIYAEGALAAALWAKNKAPGLYGMRDVVGAP